MKSPWICAILLPNPPPTSGATMRSRSLAFAVEEAYAGLLQTGRHPIAVVDLRLPPEEVDVNVHPAKVEVRLRNERAVFALLQRPIRRALAGLPPVGSESLAGWPRPDRGGAGFVFSVPTQPEAPLQSQLMPSDAPPGFEQGSLPASLPRVDHDTGEVSVAGLFERFVTSHLEGHVDQLREILESQGA